MTTETDTAAATTAPLDPALASRLDAWIDAHFDEQVRFLQALVQVPTDTPPGDNRPHAERTAALLGEMGFVVEQHSPPAAAVAAAGLQSISNLVVRQALGGGPATGRTAAPTIGLNAHGDVVPPGEGWSHPPYGGEIHDGRLYGRAAAVSKSDFSTYTFALRALMAAAAAQAAPSAPLAGTVELYFTYDEEFGGELGPGWLLEQGIVKPDYLVAAAFSYQVITGHNGCLQLAVTLHGRMGHAAVPHTAVDALQAAHAVMSALYAENERLRQGPKSAVKGITHGYINVGRIEGGTNTNVVPGSVLLKIDRRMIPEEDAAAVEQGLRRLIEEAVARFDAGLAARGWAHGVTVDIQRLLLAQALKPLPGNRPLVEAFTQEASAVFGEPIEASGTPLYTDARLFCEHGIPAVLYGAGPRTVLESNAKRADEHIVLDDLRRATKVVARALARLLRG